MNFIIKNKKCVYEFVWRIRIVKEYDYLFWPNHQHEYDTIDQLTIEYFFRRIRTFFVRTLHR